MYFNIVKHPGKKQKSKKNFKHLNIKFWNLNPLSAKKSSKKSKVKVTLYERTPSPSSYHFHSLVVSLSESAETCFHAVYNPHLALKELNKPLPCSNQLIFVSLTVIVDPIHQESTTWNKPSGQNRQKKNSL